MGLRCAWLHSLSNCCCLGMHLVVQIVLVTSDPAGLAVPVGCIVGPAGWRCNGGMKSSMQIGIKGIPIIHPLLQCSMPLLRRHSLPLRSANAILGGGELGLQSQRTLLCLLRCQFHGMQFRLQAEQGSVEARYLDIRATCIRHCLCSLGCCTFCHGLRLQSGRTCRSASRRACAIC